MKWIEAVFNEALRLGGPVSLMIPRKCIEDMEIGRLNISKGTAVSLVPITHHHKK
jgi:cytochrome P450